MKNIRGYDENNFINVEDSINDYLNQADWRVNANANQGYSMGGMVLNVAGKVIANYWLNHVYSKEEGDTHRRGDIHIHDADVLSSYCAGWSLRTLLEEGLGGIDNKCSAKPPKHLSSAIGQMVNFLGTLQNEWAGAQAFSSFDTYLAPFVKVDNLPYEEVKQNIQEFIFNLNVPSRWGSQTPFTNVTFDWVCPEDLRDQTPLIGGKEVDFLYGDCQKEMDMINKAYIEVMMGGDANGRVMTFPIPTYNITKDFNWDSDNVDLLLEMTSKYGLPYFQNFISSDMSPKDVRSMCCRLQLDLDQLKKRGNGLFGSSEQTGSIGVVTINCARLGYVHKGDYDGLIRELDKLLEISKSTLEKRRKKSQEFIDCGFLPFTKRYLKTLRNHFSTIGVNGMNEMVRNFTNDEYDITDKRGIDLSKKILSHIREKLVEFQEETGNLYNLEASPAESAMHRFAKEDIKRYPSIIYAGTKEAPYYTNSSQLPVGYTEDPFEALDLQEELQTMYTGGTVLHIYTNEQVSSTEICKKIIKNTLENYRVPYITITPTFSICPDHGYISGEHFTCPKCSKTTEVWTRVMGYHRPVSQFNKGKKSEYADRVCFSEKTLTEKLEA